MHDSIGINMAKSAFSKTEVMNGVEQIGLAATIGPKKAVDMAGKSHRSLPVIFKLLEAYIFQVHI